MGFIDQEHPSLFLAVAISVAVHVLLLLGSVTIPAHIPQENKPTIIEVWPTAPQEIEKMAAANRGALRITDIAEPPVQKRPKSARFAGMYDSSVEEETVSRHGSKGLHGGGGSGKGKDKGTGKGKGSGRATTQSKVAKDKLMDFDRDLFAMREPTTETTRSRIVPQQPVGRVSIGGGGGGGDFFPDVKMGDHTYLNVLRYPEISYFVRLKRVFRTTFNPVPALRNYFSTNTVARGSIEVVMAVGVDGTGALSELFVLRGSGVPSYDHEAMRTVRASSPFSKPPAKFLADDGNLRMMWTFTVYL